MKIHATVFTNIAISEKRIANRGARSAQGSQKAPTECTFWDRGDGKRKGGAVTDRNREQQAQTGTTMLANLAGCAYQHKDLREQYSEIKSARSWGARNEQ